MKPGDRIAVIDDELEGIVTEINGNQITFESPEGFTYTYSKEKVVVVAPDFQQKIERQKIQPKEPPKATQKKKATRDKPVFDLHLDVIQQRHHHLSDAQKLEIQLQEVRRILHKMQVKNQKEFVLIHGVGAGVLRREILKILREKDYQYSDASYVKYGNGALLVLR